MFVSENCVGRPPPPTRLPPNYCVFEHSSSTHLYTHDEKRQLLILRAYRRLRAGKERESVCISIDRNVVVKRNNDFSGFGQTERFSISPVVLDENRTNYEIFGYEYVL